MDFNSELEEQLDRYLLKRMSTEEQTTFEASLKQNPELALKVKLHSEMAQGIQTYVNRNMRGKLKTFQQEWYDKQKNKTIEITRATEIKKEKVVPQAKRRTLAPILAIAASLLLVLSVAFWVINSPQSAEELYLAYYEPYPSMFSSRSATSEQALMEANEHYIHRTYGQALLGFEKLLQDQPDNAKLLLVSGICQMEEGKLEEAKTKFQKIIDNNDLYLLDQAIWYMALVELKQNNESAAQKLLKELVAKPKADRKAKAEKLLEALGK